MKRNSTKKQNQTAFTLAEVLITIAVIGIVAILTIPVLSAKWQRKFYVTALRKKLAEFTQVVNLSVLENGVTSSWDWSLSDEEFVSKYFYRYMNLSACDNCWSAQAPLPLFFIQSAEAAPEVGGGSDTPESNAYQNSTNCRLAGGFDECLTGGNCAGWYGNQCEVTMEACDNGDSVYVDNGYCEDYWASNYYKDKSSLTETPDSTFKLNDGSIIGFTKKRTTAIAYFYVDINGGKAPNKYGADKFVFVVSGNKVSIFGQGEADLTEGDYGCSDSGNKMYCAAMLAKNNWEYPDNYPKI